MGALILCHKALGLPATVSALVMLSGSLVTAVVEPFAGRSMAYSILIPEKVWMLFLLHFNHPFYSNIEKDHKK